MVVRFVLGSRTKADILADLHKERSDATRNKCIATSHKCLTSSNKKLLGARTLLGAPGIATNGARTLLLKLLKQPEAP